MSKENVAIARRWFDEVWNQRRMETVYELLTPDSLCESESGPIRGPEEFINRAYQPFITIFPDLKMTVDDIVAEGNRVVVRWTAAGTHSGTAFEIAPTGHRVTIRGMTWIRIVDGKMVNGMDCWNQSGLIQALTEARPCASIALD